MINFRATAQFDKQATVVLLSVEELKQKKFRFQNNSLKANIRELQRGGKFNAEKGEVFPLVIKGKTVLLAGLGKKADLTLTALRIFVRKALLSPYLSKIKDFEIVPHASDEKAIRAVIEGVLIGTYAWKKYVKGDEKQPGEKKIWLVAAKKAFYENVIRICEGVNLARDLINDNADTVTSSFFEATVKKLVKGKRGVSVEILNRRQMENKGLGLHLAVNHASRKEPKLIIVKYKGGRLKESFTAVLGKGITFDTGGLNLKPTGYMETMRSDMSGAAAVVGTLKNVLNLNLKKNIIFAVTLAENAIGSGAYKPGDVFRSYSGKTVEIGNTDAEGRLVLADAISYLVKNYKPTRIVNLATLTGACVVALGYDYAGLMSNDDAFAKRLLDSAHETDDRAWQLPIYPELKEHVKSQVADIKNTGLAGAAGALSAGEFLRQFTENTKWAHLDIAGTAFIKEAGRLYYGHGATGFGVRLITDFLQKN